MKIVAFCFVVGSFIACTKGLKCMTCYTTGSFEDCDVNGKLKQCMPNQDSCETVVRRSGSHMTVMKGCKNSRACENNQMQNRKYSGRSTQCNADQINSVCTCCCNDDLCNGGAPTCVEHYKPTQPLLDCPQVRENFPHGKIECYNENKAGALCEYQCTAKDYAVWPPKRTTNVCLANGTWAHEEPCCARPCPPYYLFDNILMFHFGGEDGTQQLENTLNMFSSSPIAEDALKEAALYFSGEPIESSVVKFNEYGADLTRMVQLIKERIKAVNEGGPDVGAAIQYAMDNLFIPEAGARDDRVPKSITILTNRNPDDDATEVAEEARRRGILIYFLGTEVDNYKFDREKILDITGEKEHIYIFGQSFNTLTADLLTDMTNHFCQNPCDHVLHDHN